MKNKKFFLLIAIVLVFSVVITGCGRKISEKITEKVIEKAMGSEDVKIDTKDGVSIETEQGSMKAGENLKWPASSMGTIPEPDAEIVSIFESKDDNLTMVTFEFKKENQGPDYLKKLLDMGYEQTSISTMGEVTQFTGVKDDDTQIIFTNYTDSKTGMINYTINNEQVKKYFQEKQSNPVVEEPIKVDMTDSMQWPKDEMNDIPEINAKINATSISKEYVMMDYEGLNRQDVFKYIGKLKSLGYTKDIYEIITNNSLSFTGSNKDKFSITINWQDNRGSINYNMPRN